MIPKKIDYTVGNLFQFSPYIIFLTVYSSLYCYTLHTNNLYHSSTIILANLPIFAVFIATMYAFFTFKEKLNIDKKIELFLSGVANNDAIYCYFLIIFIAIFNQLIAKNNGVLTAVTLGLLYVPIMWIMPCMFSIAAIFSIIMSSLPAAIIICMPVAHGIAQSLHINSAFMAATIIGGALCGNHLSLFLYRITNHTTINSTNLINLYKKTIWFIIPAAISSLIILSQYQYQQLHPSIYIHLQSSLKIQNYITIIPYFFLVIASFLRINLLANLIIACCITLITEVLYHKILFLDAFATMFNGFMTESIVVNLLFIHLLIAGLANIIKYNGGFNYMIEILRPQGNQHKSNVQASIIGMTIITNILVIIDTLALNLIDHPIEKFAERYHVANNKAYLLLEITTTIMQAIIPYSSIMFLTIFINKCSYFEIMSYMFYPGLVALFTVLSIFYPDSEHKKNYHTSSK